METVLATEVCHAALQFGSSPSKAALSLEYFAYTLQNLQIRKFSANNLESDSTGNIFNSMLSSTAPSFQRYTFCF